MPLICDTLARLNESGRCSVKKLEGALGLAPRSGYPFLSHRVLDAQELRQLFHSLKGQPEAQEALLAFLVEGSGWVVQYVAADTDVNGDGDVNTSDVLDAAIMAMESNAEALHTARAAERSGFKSLSPTELERLTNSLRGSMRHILAAINVLSFLAERTRPVSVSLTTGH